MRIGPIFTQVSLENLYVVLSKKGYDPLYKEWGWKRSKFSDDSSLKLYIYFFNCLKAISKYDSFWNSGERQLGNVHWTDVHVHIAYSFFFMKVKCTLYLWKLDELSWFVWQNQRGSVLECFGYVHVTFITLKQYCSRPVSEFTSSVNKSEYTIQ